MIGQIKGKVEWKVGIKVPRDLEKKAKMVTTITEKKK